MKSNFLVGMVVFLTVAAPMKAEEISGDTTSAPLFTSTPTILLRTPNPAALAEFYVALGMKVGRVSERGSVFVYLDGNVGSLEILAMDPNTQPGGPKTSRTQQGVVAIFETTDQEEVVRRARAAGSPMIEKWTSSQADVSIYYIADPENNIFGFAPVHHNPHIPTPDPIGIERSELFGLDAGDRVEDTGRLVVTGGRFDRVEDFEVVRTADGGRVISSVVTGAGDSYRVQGNWEYLADEQALAATGIGKYKGGPVMVNIQTNDGSAALRVTGARDNEHVTPCDSDCLIDMSPSALPMFTMTRRYDEARGGAQSFDWIARSLIADQVLLEATAAIEKLGEFVFDQNGRQIVVMQYAFVETMKDEASGKTFQGAFNLYTTADHRPLAFATGGKTVGERMGYEGITAALPPKIPALD